MTVKEATNEWGLSKKKVYEVCKALQLEKDSKNQYIIPQNMKHPYYPDKRFFHKRNPLHIYIYTIDAIAEEKTIIPNLLNTDDDHICTAVRELKKRDVIVLLERHLDDNDYKNYMISPGYADWRNSNIREKIKIVKDISEIAVNLRNSL